jgi:hypothetical protein
MRSERMQAPSSFLRFPVTSSSIATIGYSPMTREMEVVFSRGAVYRYLDVPAPVFASFFLAASKGRYFNSNVKNRYPFRRV